MRRRTAHGYRGRRNRGGFVSGALQELALLRGRGQARQRSALYRDHSHQSPAHAGLRARSPPGRYRGERSASPGTPRAGRVTGSVGSRQPSRATGEYGALLLPRRKPGHPRVGRAELGRLWGRWPLRRCRLRRDRCLEGQHRPHPPLPGELARPEVRSRRVRADGRRRGERGQRSRPIRHPGPALVGRRGTGAVRRSGMHLRPTTHARLRQHRFLEAGGGPLRR